jgi:hypothetical protein
MQICKDIFDLQCVHYDRILLSMEIKVRLSEANLPKKKGRLLNIRIEKDLHERFMKVCKRSFKRPASKVLRALIEEICVRYEERP